MSIKEPTKKQMHVNPHQDSTMKRYVWLALLSVQFLLTVEGKPEWQSNDNDVINDSFSQEELERVSREQAPKIDATTILHPDSGKRASNRTSKILGGSDAALGQFPWHAFMLIRHNDSTSILCTGSLISAEWILTTSFCVKTALPASNHVAMLGSVNWQYPTAGSVSRNGIKILVNNGRALIQIEPVTFTANIRPIALPSFSEASETYQDVKGLVSGYDLAAEGSTKVGPTLKYTTLTVIPDSVCISSYGVNAYTSTHLCAQDLTGLSGYCAGDYGSALVYKNAQNTWQQIGIVASSNNKCLAYPLRFYRLTYSLLEWISTQVPINGTTTTLQPTTTTSTPLPTTTDPPPTTTSTPLPFTTDPPPTTTSTPPPFTTDPPRTTTTSTPLPTTTVPPRTTTTTQPPTTTTSATTTLCPVSPTTTSAPTTTSPNAPVPKCSLERFTDMIASCCLANSKPLIPYNSRDRTCSLSSYSWHVFNNYTLNMWQKLENFPVNSINFYDPSLMIAMGRDACFTNCYLVDKGVMTKDNQIKDQPFIDLVTAARSDTRWKSTITTAALDCLSMVRKLAVPKFLIGCDSRALITFQCIQFKLIQSCQNQNSTCNQKYDAFNRCGQKIF